MRKSIKDIKPGDMITFEVCNTHTPLNRAVEGSKIVRRQAKKLHFSTSTQKVQAVECCYGDVSDVGQSICQSIFFPVSPPYSIIEINGEPPIEE